MFFGEVFGVTFSFHSSLPCLWAIIGGHFCFIFITLRGTKASEKPGGFDFDAVGNGGQYHFSGTFWPNLAALAGGVGEIIMKNRVESNGTSWNAMHVIEFPLLKTQTCTFSSSKKNKIEQQSVQHPFSLHNTQVSKFQTLPPLSNMFFPTQFPQSFPTVVSRPFFHPWVASWPLPSFQPPTPWLPPRHPRRWPLHKGWSQGHGPWPKECHRCCLEVGRVGVMELERSERSETSTYIQFFTSIFCHDFFLVLSCGKIQLKHNMKNGCHGFVDVPSWKPWAIEKKQMMPTKFNTHTQKIRWSLMLGKSFVAAYLILAEEMHLYINIYQLTFNERRFVLGHSSHAAKRSVPNSATELLPWLAFLSGRCLVTRVLLQLQFEILYRCFSDV